MSSRMEPKRKKRRENSEYNDEINGAKDFRGNLDPSKFPPGFLDQLGEIELPTASLLSPDDLADEENEVWILQCPAQVNPAELLAGRKIKLNGSTVLSDESGQQQASFKKQFEVLGLPRESRENREQNLVALLPNGDGRLKLVAAAIHGHILIRENLEEMPIPELTAEFKPPHKLPAGIKERHPIYGTDFDSVQTEMQSRQSTSGKERKSKKKSKKHKKDRDDEEKEDDEEEDSNIHLTNNSPTKLPPVEEINGAAGLSTKKSKRRSHKSVVVDGIPNNFPDPAAEVTTKANRKIKTEILTPNCSSEDEVMKRVRSIKKERLESPPAATAAEHQLEEKEILPRKKSKKSKRKE